jgi:acetyl esterase/lipase
VKKENMYLSEDKYIHLTAYLHEYSAEMPLWKTRPAVVVLPGGGYQWTSDREADPVALSFLAQGFHAFVLRYSVAERARFPNPLRDVSRALASIREHAEVWGVHPQQIAVCGFSAGGHLAASLGTLWNDPEIVKAAGVNAGENQPNALLLCYPVISARHHAKANWFTSQTDGHRREAIIEKLSCELHVGTQTPPTFLFHTYDDNLVPVENSLLFANALAQADIPFEMHLFQRGSHGVALANELTSAGGTNSLDVSAERWFVLATEWLWRLFGQPRSSNGPASGQRAHFDEPVMPLP